MRVLVICDAHPFPLTNGQNLRIFHYVRHLKDRHVFDLLSVGDPAVPQELIPLFNDIRVIPPSTPPSPSPLQSIARKLSLSGRQLFYHSDSAATVLAEIARRKVHDLFWFSGGGTLNTHLPQPAVVPVLADVVDSLVLTQLRQLQRASGPFDHIRQAKRLFAAYNFERYAFRGADEAVFVAEGDAAMFHRICPGVPVSVVHNGVDEEYFVPPAARSARMRIAFEGNMGFSPNVEAAQTLCRQILPLIRSKIPDVEIAIIGRDPAPAVVALAAADGVEVTGLVEDVRPHLAECAVFACPMQSGAGIKNKILQAWSMGMPVVATTLAIGGLRVQQDVNAVLADEPLSFARALVALLRDRARADAIGAAGRRTVIEGYTWSIKARELEQVMLRVSSAGKSRLAVPGPR